MAKKKSYEEVKEYIESFGYKLISKEYVNNTKPLLLQCKHGHQFEISYNHFQQYKIERCPYCNGSRFTFDYVKQYIESFEYILLSSEYNNANEKIEIMCDKGHIYKTTFSQFKYQNQRCPYCSGNAKYTYEEVKEYIESFGYELISKEYINSKTHLIVKCSCGNEYAVTFTNFKRGRRCNECNKSKWNKEKIISYINNETDFDFIRFIEFNKVLSIIELKCKYGHIFTTRFNGIIYQNSGCPKCRKSKGEKKIYSILKNDNVYFLEQYKFDDCKYKNSLPFDFYIPSLNICIEYDGIQHYKPSDYFGGYEKFLETRRNDVIKTQYCKQNNIKLIRIPYWEYDNIEEILIKELNLK